MHSKLRKAMIRIELSLGTSTFGETIRMLLQTNGLKERTGFLWRHKKKGNYCENVYKLWNERGS